MNWSLVRMTNNFRFKELRFYSTRRYISSFSICNEYKSVEVSLLVPSHSYHSLIMQWWQCFHLGDLWEFLLGGLAAQRHLEVPPTRKYRPRNPSYQFLWREEKKINKQEEQKSLCSIKHIRNGMPLMNKSSIDGHLCIMKGLLQNHDIVKLVKATPYNHLSINIFYNHVHV